jgi:hypothetical protein
MARDGVTTMPNRGITVRCATRSIPHTDESPAPWRENRDRDSIATNEPLFEHRYSRRTVANDPSIRPSMVFGYRNQILE